MSLDIVTRQAGSATVLDLSGRLTAGAGAARLREAIDGIALQDGGSVLLNFQNVAFLDSAGLGSLVVISDLLRTRGSRLCIINTHGSVQHVLQITRLDRVLPHFADESAALASC